MSGHVLQNPVDTISTEVILLFQTLGETNRLSKSHVQINNSNLLDDKIHSVMCLYKAVHHMQGNPNMSQNSSNSIGRHHQGFIWGNE